MAAKQCPKCLMWVNDEQRMSGQCPGCKTFFESELPAAASGTTSAASGAPIIQTDTPESPTARVKRGAGLWSLWWIIPVIFIARIGCRAALQTQDRGARPTYEQYDQYDQDRIRQILEQAREDRPTNEFTMGPDFEIEPTPTDVDPFDVELPDPDPFEKLELAPE